MVNMRQVSPSTLIFSSIVYLANHMSIINPYVDVQISQGWLRGVKSVSRIGRPYIEFLGIRFAKKPLGELRFEPPEPPDNWTGIFRATSYGAPCLQYEFLTHSFLGSEDCLTLNVFTHQVLKNNQSSTPLNPVIVYKYGGLYMSGFSIVYRPKYLMDEDVVLVTSNFRVNSFGFLNTGDDVVRGNAGLKDQVMVLKWVQQNIKYFGGDPNRVTLMGQSAGGASAHYHLLSNLSKGLFHRAISQSGTSLQPWAFSEHPYEQSRRLAKALGCPTADSKALVRCLKSRSATEIARSHKEYLDPLPDPLTLFGPSIEAVKDDKAFLTEHPRDILRSGKIPNKGIPWIVGATSGEGLLGVGYLLKKPEKLRALNLEWYKYAPIIFSYRNHPNRDNISRSIRSYYFQDRAIDANSFEQIAQLYSDRIMYCDVQDAVELHSKSAPVYPYVFNYRGDSGLPSILERMVGGIPRLIDFAIGTSWRWFTGKVCQNCLKGYKPGHADELVYQFNIPGLSDEITPGSIDYEFSKAFIKLWLSFIKDGYPSDFLGVKWNPVKSESSDPLPFLEIDDSPEILLDPFRNISAFWKSLNLK